MITVFARDFGGGVQPPTIQSVYFDDAGGQFNGLSYLSGPWSNSLNAQGFMGSGAFGYTLSTWVKPNWSASSGQPVGFMHLELDDAGLYLGHNQIIFGYDSETSQDSIFLYLNVGDDEFFHPFWFYAPVASDPFNAAITGISPSGTGYNSWNGTTGFDFVHLAVHFDVNGSPPAVSGGLTTRATIYWNGQALRTFENYVYPNIPFWPWGQGSLPVQCTIGNYWYARAHWQDRTSLWSGVADSNIIQNDFYGNGTPADPVVNTELHYNYENPSPFNSNGLVSYVMSSFSANGANDPVIDPTQGVA